MFYKLYFIALPIFIILDLLWIGVIANGFYKKHIGHLMTSNINLIAVVLFYVIFLAGLVTFVLIPSLEARSIVRSIMYGALFGLVTYATYDFTNLATLKNWSVLVTVVDLFWGAFLSASVSGLTFWIYTATSK